MSEMNLIEKATIRFKKPLREEEVRELFVYLARNLDNSDIMCEYRRAEDILGNMDSHAYPIVKSFDVSGSIFLGERYRDKRCLCASFNSIRSIHPYTGIDAIRFFTAPGYDTMEVSEGEILLFEDTQRYADKFVEILEDRED